MNSPYMLVHFALCIVTLFAICSVLEMLRQAAWKPTDGKWLCNSNWLKMENEWEQRIFAPYAGKGN